MVTASHNPKEDNGYKVYWTNGSQVRAHGEATFLPDAFHLIPLSACRPQIIPPHDVDIAACIEANIEPWAAFDRSTVRSDPRCVDPTKEVEAAYFTKLRSFATQPEANAVRAAAPPRDSQARSVPDTHPPDSPRLPSSCTPPCTGWGHPPRCGPCASSASPTAPWCRCPSRCGPRHLHTPLLLALACSPPVCPCLPPQCDPDPTFPSVPFPNPEEGKGALQLSMAKAAEVGATVVLANDPDADRLAVAELLEGAWRGKGLCPTGVWL